MPSNDFPPLRPRSDWLLDPGVTFLNHGSFGAAPRAVLAEQARWRERMERQPTAFMSFELPGALRAAAEKLAAFVGAAAGDLVFVENATAGCNAVLHSLPLAPGDEILLTDHGYPAVRKAAAHVAARTGARLIEATIPFPLHARAEILAALAARLTSRTRLLIVDHVTSPTASIMPVAELAALARAAGARVLVDGAHAPGMLSLDVSAIGGDWYVGNCHKWLMAPKGSAFIWAAPARQGEIQPLVTSHGSGQGFHAEFDWVGTRDPTAWLSVPAAIDWHIAAGGAALRQRNAALVETAAQELATQWKTEVGSPTQDSVAMKTVRLPFSGAATQEAALDFRALLFRDHRIDVAVVAFAGSLWTRISAQAYNSLPEYRLFAGVVRSRRNPPRA